MINSGLSIKSAVLLTGSLFLLSACTYELDLDIPEPPSKLVIEGWIEQDKPARVILTQSVPFFSDLDSVTITDIPITHAKVTLITDGGNEIMTLKPNTSYFPPYVYSSTEIKGAVNQRYQIVVNYRGHEWKALTTIPEPAFLDSTWFESEPGFENQGRVWIRFTDDPTTIDYYRVLVKVNGKDTRFVPCYASTFSDRYFSGETFELGLLRGMGSILDLGESRLFVTGDTIQIKFCKMDKAHYEFWNSVQASIITSSNPFASSHATIQSNVEGGYGIWGGYGTSYYTVVAK